MLPPFARELGSPPPRRSMARLRNAETARAVAPTEAWPRTFRKSGSHRDFHCRSERSAHSLLPLRIAYDILKVRCSLVLGRIVKITVIL
jgi:hypothetical protein